MAGTAGRALLIAAWVVVIGGLAGGAGYLHSLGPPPGPPELSSPEAAPAPEAPPRLDSPPAEPETSVREDGAAAPAAVTGGGQEAPAVAATGTPRLPSLDESLELPAGQSAPPPAIESLEAFVDEPDPATALGGSPASLAELTRSADPAVAERFEPETEWPVLTPELHGPMPMIARQTIDLAMLAEEVENQAESRAEARVDEPGQDVADQPATGQPDAAPPAEPAPVLETPAAETPAVPAVPEMAADTAEEAPEPATPEAAAEQPEILEPEPPAADRLAEPPPDPEPPVAAVVPEPPVAAADPEPPVAAADPEPPVAAADPEPPVAAADPEPADPAEAPVDDGLSATPDDRVVETAEIGPLPVVSSAGVRPADVYARPFDAPANRPMVAVVVSGLGLSSGATEAAIQSLPGAVTLSFSPYSGRLQDWVALARAAGHEVLIDLPMEPADFPNSDPGPQALMTSLPPDVNLQRLEWVLSRATNYIGVGSFMGSRFAADAAAMRPVLEAIDARGLIYLDNGQAIGDVASELGGEIGLPLLVSDLQVDQMAARQMIDEQLARIEAMAREDGEALAIGTAYPVTIERLAVWTRSLAERGFVLAPASALVGR